jgi:O-antigen/teichoic acid export membrane protein
MIQSVLAARLLGVAGFGVLGTITQFVSVINRLTSARMSELVVNYVGEYNVREQHQEAAAVFKTAGIVETILSVLAFGLVILLAPLGAQFFAHNPSLTNLFAIYGVMLLSNVIVESSTGLLSVFNKFQTVALINIGQSAITLLLIVLAYLSQGDLIQVVLAYLIGKIAWSLAISGVALWEARIHWGAGWWKTPMSTVSGRWRELLRFGVSSNLSVSLNLITRDSELLWLGALSTPIQVGYYKLTLAVLNVLLLPIQPLLTATYRDLALEVGNRKWENVKYLLRSGSLIVTAYTIPVCLVLAIFGEWLISIIYGAEFLPTSYVGLLIVLPGLIVVNLFYWNRKLLLTLGLPEYPVMVNFVAALVKIGLTIVIVPIAGAIGMAILLSAFFLVPTLVMVGKGLATLQRQSHIPSPSTGS